jgi:hypothetical protein
VHTKWLNEFESKLQARERSRLGEVIAALWQLHDITQAEKKYAQQAEH